MTKGEQMEAAGLALAMYDQRTGESLYHIGSTTYRVPFMSVPIVEWQGWRCSRVADVLRASA